MNQSSRGEPDSIDSELYESESEAGYEFEEARNESDQFERCDDIFSDNFNDNDVEGVLNYCDDATDISSNSEGDFEDLLEAIVYNDNASSIECDDEENDQMESSSYGYNDNGFNEAENVETDYVFGNANNSSSQFYTNVSNEEDDDDRGSSTDDDFVIFNESINYSDILKMVEVFRIRHNLTWKAVEDLNSLINRILGSNRMPTTTYLYKKKLCCTSNIETTLHFCCNQCNLYLGTEDQLKQTSEKNCSICRTEISTETKYKKNFFVTVPIAPQIKRLIEDSIDDIILDNSASGENIYDIYDGKTYQTINRNLDGADFITLSINTDGGQVFRKAKNASLWPIQLYVNEFKQSERFKRDKILCSGFWFGQTPDMGSFLRPLIEEINIINGQGGLTLQLGNCEKRVLVIPFVFTLDSVAKCHVMNKVQFNGYDGCPVCEHPGSLVEKQIRYCNCDNSQVRTNTDIIRNMKSANEIVAPQKGFKGLSPLLAIQVIEFNFVWQIVIDEMHALHLGVMKKLLDLWLSSKNYKER